MFAVDELINLASGNVNIAGCIECLQSNAAKWRARILGGDAARNRAFPTRSSKTPGAAASRALVSSRKDDRTGVYIRLIKWTVEGQCTVRINDTVYRQVVQQPRLAHKLKTKLKTNKLSAIRSRQQGFCLERIVHRNTESSESSDCTTVEP